MSTNIKAKPAKGTLNGSEVEQPGAARPQAAKTTAAKSGTQEGGVSDNAPDLAWMRHEETDAKAQAIAATRVDPILDKSAKPEGKTVTIAPAIANAFTKMQENGILSKATRAARAQAAFQTIRLTMAPQIEAMLTLHELFLMGQDEEVVRKPIAILFSPTGVGKTTTADQFTAITMADAEEDTAPVLNVRLGSSGSALQLYEAMMSGLGEHFPTSKDTTTLRHRTIEALSDACTNLVILDETQHSEKGSGFGSAITAELKLLIDTGNFSIVLLGTEKAKAVIMRDRELVSRLLAPCNLDPLKWHDDDDQEIWVDMLDELDAEMQRLELVPGPIGLAEGDLAEALCTACGGTVGQLMCVLQHALKVAIYDNRDEIVLADIAIAVDDWSIALDFASENPVWPLVEG